MTTEGEPRAFRTVTRLVSGALTLVALSSEAQEDRHEFTLQLDVRLVATDIERSFTDGGLGLSRFDESHEDVQLGRAFVDYRGRVSETVDLELTLDAYGDDDKNPVDVSEAFVEWRPYPFAGWRWRTRLGAFYPPISLENRAPGWQSVYSISPSAINTWIGEEIRTVGAEVNATWLGARLGNAVDLSLIAAVYGWNDPMGVVIFQRGWGIHDRQTALFGELPKMFPQGTTRHGLELFHEIDDRAGYYAGVQVSWPERLVFRALHYDNRGDPGANNGYEYAWLSRFDSAGARLDWPRDWTLILQRMAGDTAVGPSADGRGLMILDYESYFVLLSRELGRHRVSFRYDDLHTETVRGAQFFNSYQDAEGVLLAYMFDYDAHWQLALEALQIRGLLEQREVIGLDEHLRERTLQLALRYTF
jgi:hypothetical protein